LTRVPLFRNHSFSTNDSETPNIPSPSKGSAPGAAGITGAMEAYERLHRRIAALHAPEIADLHLTLAQLKVVYIAAAAGPIHMSVLAEQLGTALSTTSGVVDRLVGSGWLERREDPGDRRHVFVSATPEALERLADMTELGRERMRQLLLHLPDQAAVDTVQRALGLLADSAATLSQETAPA